MLSKHFPSLEELPADFVLRMITNAEWYKDIDNGCQVMVLAELNKRERNAPFYKLATMSMDFFYSKDIDLNNFTAMIKSQLREQVLHRNKMTLLQAIELNEIEIAKAKLNEKFSLFEHEHDNNWVLEKSIVFKRFELVKYLVDEMNVGFKSSYQNLIWTDARLLSYAVSSKSFEVVKFLLDRGADTQHAGSVCMSDTSPEIAALIKGTKQLTIDVIGYSLSNTIKPIVRNDFLRYGHISVHSNNNCLFTQAVDNNDLNLLDCLLTYADVTALNKFKTLLRALVKKKLNIVKCLIEFGCSKNSIENFKTLLFECV